MHLGAHRMSQTLCWGSFHPFAPSWDSEGTNTFLQGSVGIKTCESKAQPDLSGPKET